MTPDGLKSGHIEIFAPCEAALKLTKLILFQPFDLGKWCVIGFAAFLAHLSGGFHLNFNTKSPLGNAKWSMRSTTDEAMQAVSSWPSWVIPLIVIGAIVVIVVIVLLAWIGSRGRFIFTDCVVRNRGRIVEPWHDFRKEGNSFFGFLLLVWLGILVLTALASAPLWLPLLLHGTAPHGFPLVFGILPLILLAVFLAVFVGATLTFMVPIMYRRRCGATEGFSAVLRLITTQPGPVILYFLFSIVLWIAFLMVACLTTCLTCCITAIPYVGTVILLPAYVFFKAYLLLFLRQFGPDFDVWANVTALAPAALSETPPQPAAEPPAEPPPLQS